MNFPTEFLQSAALHRKSYHAAFAPLCQEYDLAQIEAAILLFLKNNPTLNTATEIVTWRGLSKSNVSAALDNLRRRGLLSVEKDSVSRRTNRLFLLAEGDQIAARLQLCQSDYFSRLLEGIPEETLKTVFDFYRQINHNLSEMS